MAKTKEDVIREGGVTNQQSLVKKLLPSATKTVRFSIPGGKYMLQEIDQSTMERTVWNWLKFCRHFDEAALYLSSDMDSLETRKVLLVEFDQTRNGQPIWEMHKDQKRYLSRLIADVINERKFVAIRATREALYLIEEEGDTFGPDSDSWAPYWEFRPQKLSRGEYSAY
jgi:hypothetical protein